MAGHGTTNAAEGTAAQLRIGRASHEGGVGIGSQEESGSGTHPET